MQKQIEGMSILTKEDAEDFLKRYVVFEEVLEKPPKEKKRRRRTERKAT